MLARSSLVPCIDSQSHLDAGSGQPCGIKYGSPRGCTYSACGGSDLAVSVQARHGRVTLLGPYEIIYRSAPGYVGPDRFTFESTGEVMPVRGLIRRRTAHVSVDVTVGRQARPRRCGAAGSCWSAAPGGCARPRVDYAGPRL